MLLQAVALAGTALAGSFLPWAASAILLGVGTAMVYPTLLAAISDVAHPSWRATAVGVYRLWRDTGFAVGALLAGLVADLAGLEAAVWVVAALTAASGLVVAVRMYETHRPAARHDRRRRGSAAAVRDLPGPQHAAGLPVPGRPDRPPAGPPGRAGGRHAPSTSSNRARPTWG